MARRIYIWELPEWPSLRWNEVALRPSLTVAYERRGELRGLLAATPSTTQHEAELEALSIETVENSEIEGERIDLAAVRSSLARRLGIPTATHVPPDLKTEGVAELTFDSIKNYQTPLTRERLFEWHENLFPADREKRSLDSPIGRWRTAMEGVMQVVSGPVGNRCVHFEAPPAEKVADEMQTFLEWFNAPENIDGIIFAGIAHLRYLAIHPFFDGNGRTARALTDFALARSEQSPARYYSLSRQILAERRAYYDALESAQSGTVDITPWLQWFTGCYCRALETATVAARDVLRATSFWLEHAGAPFTERQRRIVKLLLDGFVGNFTVKKWVKIAKVSEDAAYRDISDLMERGILTKQGGSKNTHYVLNGNPSSAR